MAAAQLRLLRVLLASCLLDRGKGGVSDMLLIIVYFHANGMGICGRIVTGAFGEEMERKGVWVV